jgi:pimeloyl-ACP methyl ester carboxylesterase
MLFKNAKIDCLNIFYREAGEQGAPKLVLLHGFPASSRQYRNLMPALAEGFHVIAPDYLGFGKVGRAAGALRRAGNLWAFFRTACAAAEEILRKRWRRAPASDG